MPPTGKGTPADPVQFAPEDFDPVVPSALFEKRRRRRPIKGGGAKIPNHKPPSMLKNLADKIIALLGGKLRAVLKNFTTTILGVIAIVQGLLTDSSETVWAGVALILGRQAWTSSQESGIRPEVVENVAPFEDAKKKV